MVVSFVSVTQQFNTTTSMGRLTLNVLLSFAQFEREVTSERIRDKIAASKRKCGNRVRAIESIDDVRMNPKKIRWQRFAAPSHRTRRMKVGNGDANGCPCTCGSCSYSR
jgi:DNA invertase Pin-like site-specific DNA recombinase